MPIIDWEGRKIDAMSQLIELDRIDYEDDLHRFLKGCWRYIDTANFIDSWSIEAVCEHLEAVADGEIRNLMIHIPPRMGKSSMISVAFPAWVWAQPWTTPVSRPGVPILCCSYASKLAVRDSNKCRRLIKSPWYQRYWGNRFQIDIDGAIRFTNTRGGERLISSVDGGVTGEGGNIHIIDDPNNARDVLSEAVIQTTNHDWWDGAMSTRLNDPRTGARIVVQQRLGELDLSGYIMSKEDWPDWTHLMLPMEYEPARAVEIYPTKIGWSDPRTDAGELLCPERFGHREVSILRSGLGSWRAAGQLQQRPEPEGGGIIKRTWWNLWPPEGELVDNVGRPVKQMMFPGMDYILASLDTAYTEETRNDPSALTVWGVFSGETVARDVKDSATSSRRVYGEAAARVMMMFSWHGRKEINDLVRIVGAICSRPAGVTKTVKLSDGRSETFSSLGVDKLLIENKAAGISVAQELRRLFAHEGFGIQLNDPGRIDKTSRLYSVQPIFEEGSVFAPDRQWAEDVMAQCGTFPNAAHDDLVDTVSQALRHLRDLGMLSRSQERLADLDEGLRAPIRLPRLYPA